MKKYNREELLKLLQNYTKSVNMYLENKIMGSNSESLTYLLYNGIVKFLNQSIVNIEHKRFDKANESLIRAQDIISELNRTLNMDIEISQNLNQLYNYMLESLQKANLEKNIAIINDVLNLSLELRDTWKQIYNIK